MNLISNVIYHSLSLGDGTRLLWLFLEVIYKILTIVRDNKSEDSSGSPCITRLFKILINT